MTTVPAQSFSAPARARVMAAIRLIPGVWGVLGSSSSPRTTRTPRSRQSVTSAVWRSRVGNTGAARGRRLENFTRVETFGDHQEDGNNDALAAGQGRPAQPL